MIVRLYHFTTKHHLASILIDGALGLTESNLSVTVPHAGPDVVWCFDTPTPKVRPGMLTKKRCDGGRPVPTDVRFTLDVPDEQVARWPEWSAAHGIDRQWYRGLAQGGDPGEWWVVLCPVPRERWIDVAELETVPWT